MQRPNVVMVCVDQGRGDALSAAGHPVVRTPYLDQLAGEGTRFSRAYSATPTCVPARVALMTGQSQERHGRVGYCDGIPFDDVRLHDGYLHHARPRSERDLRQVDDYLPWLRT